MTSESMIPSGSASRIPIFAWMISVGLGLAVSGCSQTDTPADTATKQLLSAAPNSPPPTSLPADVDLAPYAENNHYISENEYVIDPGFVSEGIIKLGDGVDMSDPHIPARRVGKNPLGLGLRKTAGPQVSDYTLSGKFRFVDQQSEREEGLLLAANFKGTYGLASAKAAMDLARKESGRSRSVYALLEVKGLTRDIGELAGPQGLAWDPSKVPLGEGTPADPMEFRRQFLLDFGSHYVASITYGYRLAIRGKMTTSNANEQARIAAAFNASFVTGSASGDISADHRKTLSQSGLELVMETTSGGLYAGEDYRDPILTGLDGIVETLRQLRAGELSIRAAPIAATVHTYWNRLPPDFRLSRALLSSSAEPLPPERLHGVPSGTVVAWSPPPQAIEEDKDTGALWLRVPQGWLVCNGEDGTPDLRDRFIRGTGDIASLRKPGGSAQHTHTGSTAAPDVEFTGSSKNGAFKPTQLSKPSHTHATTVTKTTVLPPYVQLVYLMKR